MNDRATGLQEGETYPCGVCYVEKPARFLADRRLVDDERSTQAGPVFYTAPVCVECRRKSDHLEL